MAVFKRSVNHNEPLINEPHLAKYFHKTILTVSLYTDCRNSFDNFKVENAAHLLTFPHKVEQVKNKEVQYLAIDVLSIIRTTLEVFPEGSRHEY